MKFKTPLVIDKDGVVRFRENKIVSFLLEAGPYDLNSLAIMNFSDEDRMQFAQLIGYSVSGYGDLSYVSEESCHYNDKRAAKFLKKIKKTKGA